VLRGSFSELAGEINTGMPDYVVHRVADALNAKGKAIKGSRILVLGLAYKPNVEDERESPSYRPLEKLAQRTLKWLITIPMCQ
jgi:UDP-N-acetyl-D-glucosamine dehydrogenase